MNPKNLIHILSGIICIGLLPSAQAVVPPPDGGYPNFTTAEGTKALQSLTSGAANTGVGWHSLFSNTEGSFNTATGAGTLLFNTAHQNTAFGAATLLFNTIGADNTATGAAALLNNTEGQFNTANGAFALHSNTTGNENTANGRGALFSNTTGSDNTANGVEALSGNTTGGSNTANGFQSLLLNTTGSYNTANGFQALVSNATGSQNTASGWSALAHNTTGDFNTAIGFDTLRNNSTGFQNTATGYQALRNNDTGFKNTASGYQALLNNTGSGNTVLGYLAGQNLTIGDDNICIGNDGIAGDAGVIRIGRSFITATYIAGISGQTAPGGTAVFVDGDGKLGTSTSSARFKHEIKPMGEASEVILALRPVSFRYKKEIDPQGLPHFGLVAEEVEKVNPHLIVRDKEGKPYSVRYEQVNAMLLNEFLKEHRKNEAQQGKMEEQDVTISRLKSTLTQQQKRFESRLAKQEQQIAALTADLQRLAAGIELNKAEPRTVAEK